MPLSAGTRLGVYEIVDALGAGGMGEVYRARDTKLGRAVAIKVLPDALAADPDRVARFEREAKSLAALNHPHIAALFGLEHSGDRAFLVMELVEGETLADRLARGPMPLPDTLSVARQIAEALEAAHEQGIVHRDLKPANVRITPDEKVKVLDFGLAKAVEPTGSGAAGVAGAVSASPTLSMMATQAGVILGTAAYMSPEQAKGLPADQRSDVFSFGVVLYEMLTGRPPFRGDTAPEILASVLIRDADLNTLPPNLNPRLLDLLTRCLHKNPKQRWQAIGDVRAELDTIAADPHGASTLAMTVAAPPTPLWRRAAPIVATALVIGSLAAYAAWSLKPIPRRPVTRFSIPLPDGQQFTNTGRTIVAVSPDGTAVAYVANRRLYLRRMWDTDARPIPGTDAFQGVVNPVFSPDSQSIAFFADGSLKRVAVTGGAAVTLCPATNPYGIAWAGDQILFGQLPGILRVAATGGKPETLVKVEDSEIAHGPVLLPDGDTVMFTLGKAGGAAGIERWDQAKIVAQSLKTGARRVLIEGGSDAQYVPTGHIVYGLGGVVFAVPFDARRLVVTGGPAPIVEGVMRAANAASATTHLSVSPEGTLVYAPGPASLAAGQYALVIADPNGSTQPLKLPLGGYEAPRVSPDGKRLAFSSNDARDAAVWIYDLSGTTSARRLTTVGRNRFPVWAPDGQRVTFQSDAGRDLAIYWQNADGTGTPERLTKANDAEAHVPESWSPDGKSLLYAITKQGNTTLWTLSLADKQTKPFGNVKMTRSYLPAATFSPDGRWVVYGSNDNATFSARLYAQPFPSTGTKYEIGPGIHPAWTRDGKHVVTSSSGGRLSSIAISTGPSLTFAPPDLLQRPFSDTGPTTPREFDTMPDGKMIAIAANATDARSFAELRVVLNWFEELKQRVPVK